MKTSKFTQEQREEAVSLFLKDKSKKDKICKKIKISESTLRKWVKDLTVWIGSAGNSDSKGSIDSKKRILITDHPINNLKNLSGNFINQEELSEIINGPSEFDKIIDYRLMKSRELLLVKGKEYVRGEDRFHNFTRAAEMNREKPTRALHGMLTKHLVSMLDILDDIDAGKLPSKETIDEKFGDIVVYVLLQEALIKSKFTK